MWKAGGIGKGFSSVAISNGMVYTAGDVNGDLMIFGVRGVIPEGEFERSLEEKRASIRSGTLGKRSEIFTHWSSPAITQAVSLLAFSKFLCVQPRGRARGGFAAQEDTD